MPFTNLDAGTAGRFARIALDNVARRYPYKADHLIVDAGDLALPETRHPIFCGSYDWHSSVHMHWTLVTLRRLHPAFPEAAAIVDWFEDRFTDERVAAEVAFLARPDTRTFERPYGWAWLLKLAEGLHRAAAGGDARAAGWSARLAPLTETIVARFLAWLPTIDFPVRAGTHGNSAFALLLALDYAEAVDHEPLREAVCARALAWYSRDRAYPVAYEPGGEDFLSNGLLEASLMRRVFACEIARVNGSLVEARFFAWWDAFVPEPGLLAPWLQVVPVRDRSDARLVHLDGLNLARAWCWASIADGVPDGIRTAVDFAIDSQIASALPQVVDGDYVGTHWLASFALLALQARAALRQPRFIPSLRAASVPATSPGLERRVVQAPDPA